MNKSNQSSSPLDDLLAEVKSEFEEKKKPEPAKVTPKPQNQPSSPINNLLADVKQEFEEKKASAKREPPVPPKRIPVGNQTSDNNLLGELKEEFEAKKQAEEEQKQQQLVREIQEKEQRKQRRRKALTRQAQDWLKNLDPNSDEGLWFEEFSYSYDSKLEAAIDYLEALRETRFHS
ncbi:MAG: hypothetical protein F6K10_28990 [Moorea sp. SIO2B7]|nr:hypothetical protein [Moorena sp. SIO2B7]